MGISGGPIGQALQDVVIRVDMLNSNSYSGVGNTITSTTNNERLNLAGVAFTSVNKENALRFTGAGFVTSVNNTGVSGATSRTMTCWVKFGQKANQGAMATGANGAGTGMALGTSSTVFLMGYGNSGILTTVTYNANQWYHLTYVSEFVTGTTHRLKLYVNGGIAHSSVVTGINLTNAMLRLGMDQSGFGMSGLMARANFYKTALSDREIQKSYWNYKSRFGL